MQPANRPQHSASRAHGGNRADSCPTCGATTKRRWCSAHDPDWAARKQAHAERVRLYRERAGLQLYQFANGVPALEIGGET